MRKRNRYPRDLLWHVFCFIGYLSEGRLCHFANATHLPRKAGD